MSRHLAAVGHTVPAGAGWTGPDVDPSTGRLLSVAELQQALRGAQQLARARAAGTVIDAGLIPTHPAVSPVPAAGAGRWVTVLGAHGGAGASTVALALADAAAAGGDRVHLIDTAGGALSELVAAASAELGQDASLEWRRGCRGQVTLDRLQDPATEQLRWPDLGGPPASLTVLDLGVRRGTGLLEAPPAGPSGGLVLVARLTVPGVRLAERSLLQLGGEPIVVLVGEQRWPGPVRSSLGPALELTRAAGRVVTFPVDRGLELTGLDASALPKRLRAAGHELLEVLNVTKTGDATTHQTPSVSNR